MRDADAYEVLGVAPGATEVEIKRAFRVLARRYHPDVSAVAADHERFRAARRAYEELCDPLARARVDARRRRRPTGSGERERRARAQADLLDELAGALHAFARGGSPYFHEPIAPQEPRFSGRLTGSRRFELDAVLTPFEAATGIVIPFRFHLGPRLVDEPVAIPPGARRGDRLSYAVNVAPGVTMELIVHVDIAA